MLTHRSFSCSSPLVAALLVTLAAGCAPQTQYRRTALVPQLVGEDNIRLPRGNVEATGSVAGGVHARDHYPDLGDPSVRRATLQATGRLRARLSDRVVIGGQVAVAHSNMAEDSATGTPPLESPRTYVGFGPNVSLHIPVGRRTSLGFAGALSLGVVPWSVYERTRVATSNEDGFDMNAHRLVESGREFVPLFRISAGVSHRLSEWVDLDYGLSFQNAAINVGFGEAPASGSTVSAGALGVVPWVGIGVRLDNGLLLRSSYAFPVGYGAYGSLGGGSGMFRFGIGVDI